MAEAGRRSAALLSCAMSRAGLSKAQPAVFPVTSVCPAAFLGERHHAHAPSAQQPDPPQGAVRAARSSACADVRVRPDGVRPGAYRQRTHHGGVRRDGAAAAGAVPARHLCPQHHRCGRQDQRARERERRADRRDHRAHHGGLPCRHGGSRGAAAGSGTPRDAARRRDDRAHRAADRRGPCLCGGRPCAVLGAEFRGVWTSVGTQSGRTAGRGTHRRGAVQAGFRRFRAVEALDSRSAGMGQSVGTRTPGLAHRVQCHVVALSRRDVRHPWRRHGPDLPAP